jgi:retron-type reverse transcriptase
MYAFGERMRRNYPYCPFERYADDTVTHCKTKKQARFILDKVKERMAQCCLELHPSKTKIVYCKDKDRTEGTVAQNSNFEAIPFVVCS